VDGSRPNDTQTAEPRSTHERAADSQPMLAAPPRRSERGRFDPLIDSRPDTQVDDSRTIADTILELREALPHLRVQRWADIVEIDWMPFAEPPASEGVPFFDWQTDTHSNFDDSGEVDFWDTAAASREPVVVLYDQDSDFDDSLQLSPALSPADVRFIADWASRLDIPIELSVDEIEYVWGQADSATTALVAEKVSESRRALLEGGFEPVVSGEKCMQVLDNHLNSSPLVFDPEDRHPIRYIGMAMTTRLAEAANLPQLTRPLLVQRHDGIVRPRTLGEHLATLESDPTAVNARDRVVTGTSLRSVVGYMNFGSAVRDVAAPIPRVREIAESIAIEGAQCWRAPGDVVDHAVQYGAATQKVTDSYRTALKRAAFIDREVDSFRAALEEFTPTHPFVASIELVDTTAVAPVRGKYMQNPSAELSQTLGVLLEVRLADDRVVDVIVPHTSADLVESIDLIASGIARVGEVVPGLRLPPVVITPLGTDAGLHHWDRDTKHTRTHVDTELFRNNDAGADRVPEPDRAAREAISGSPSKWWVETDLSAIEHVVIHELFHSLDAQALIYDCQTWEPKRNAIIAKHVGNVGDDSAYAVHHKLHAIFSLASESHDDTVSYQVPAALAAEVASANAQVRGHSIYGTADDWEAIAELGVAGVAGTVNRDGGSALIAELNAHFARPKQPPLRHPGIPGVAF